MGVDVGCRCRVALQACLLRVARRTRIDVALSLECVMVWPTAGKVTPALRMELDALRPQRCLTLPAWLPGDLGLLVTVHTEALLPVATAAVGVVLTRSYRVREDPVVRVDFQRLLHTVMAIHTKLRLMAVFAITIIQLGSVLVVRQKCLVMGVRHIPTCGHQLLSLEVGLHSPARVRQVTGLTPKRCLLIVMTREARPHRR